MEKRFSKVVSGFTLISLFFVHSVFAAPPGSQYVPGETDNPSCSPGDANCNVDISSIDDQILTLSGAELIISDGNSVDLTPFTGTGTDSQSLTLSGSEIIISNGNTIDISGVFTDTDTQLNESQVDTFVANNGYLTGETDGSVTNELQSLTLSGSEIIISNGNTIDISGVFTDTDTDDQTLSFSGNLLVISDGNSVDFSSYLDNTDSQSLTLSGSELSISNGNNVDLSGISGSSTLEGATDTNLIGSATGSLLYYDGGEWVHLPVGGIGQKLVSGTGGTLSWMTDTVMTGTGATGSGTSSRIGEFIYAKSGRLVSQGYLAVTPGTVTDGAIDYPLWAAMYPEYISGNDIVFPVDVDGMFLRNVGGDAAAEGTFQAYRTARPATSFTTNSAGAHSHSITGHRATSVGGGSSGNDNVLWNDDNGGSITIRSTNSAGNHSHTITGGGDTETNPDNRAYQLYTIVDTYSVGESGTSTLSGATDTNLTSQGTGSLLYYDGTEWIDLDLGTSGQTLTSSGGTLVWQDALTGETLNRGETVLGSDFDIQQNGGLNDYVDVTGLSVTLPVAGTYRLTGLVNVRNDSGDDRGVHVEIANASNVRVSNVGKYEISNTAAVDNLRTIVTIPLEATVTTTNANEVFKIRASQSTNVTFSGIETASVLKYEQLPTTEVVPAGATAVNDQSASGYIDIGNVRMQWGRGTTSAGTLVVTLPVPMADNSYAVTLTAANGSPVTMTYNSDSTTGFTAVAEGGVATSFSWQVIGVKP